VSIVFSFLATYLASGTLTIRQRSKLYDTQMIVSPKGVGIYMYIYRGWLQKVEADETASHVIRTNLQLVCPGPHAEWQSCFILNHFPAQILHCRLRQYQNVDLKCLGKSCNRKYKILWVSLVIIHVATNISKESKRMLSNNEVPDQPPPSRGGCWFRDWIICKGVCSGKESSFTWTQNVL